MDFEADLRRLRTKLCQVKAKVRKGDRRGIRASDDDISRIHYYREEIADVQAILSG